MALGPPVSTDFWWWSWSCELLSSLYQELGCLNHHRETSQDKLSLHTNPCYTSCRLRTRHVQWYYAMALSHCNQSHYTSCRLGTNMSSDDMQWQLTMFFTLLVVGCHCITLCVPDINTTQCKIRSFPLGPNKDYTSCLITNASTMH